MPAPDNFFITLTGAGSQTLVAAPAAPAWVRVLSYHASAPATATLDWKTGSTTLFRDNLAANNPVSTEDEEGVFNCNPGEALVVTGSARVDGAGRYTICGAG